MTATPRSSAPSSSAGGAARPGSAAADEEAPALVVLPPPPDRFLARGRVRLTAGWQAVVGIAGDEGRGGKEGAAETAAVLPPLAEGQALEGDFAATAKQTAPPRR